MIRKIDDNEVKKIVKKSTSSSHKSQKKEEKSNRFEREEENIALLDKSYQFWSDFSTLREERRRNINYKNGNQWSDVVEDPDFKGRTVREEELITRSGRLPLKHNIIAQIIRNLIGQMLANPTQSVVFARSDEDINLSEMLTNALSACHHLNDIQKIDISILEELLLSGIGCVKIRYDYFHDRNRVDGKIEPVNSNKLFFNSDVEDPRLFDLNFIGQLHEYSIDEIISNFASDEHDEEILRSIFPTNSSSDGIFSQFGEERAASNFYIPDNRSKHRIFEIWQREGGWVSYMHDPIDASHEITTLRRDEIDDINNERITAAQKAGGDGSEIPLIELQEKYEYFWSVRFIDSDGHTLHKNSSPFTHESHPYVIATLPMINGEFKSYISDLIDMQRYINRLIMMIDFIMGSSAKGVLMVPEDCIPDGCSIDDFAQEYVKANGIIVYKPDNKGSVPTQISNNSNPATAWDMLQTQLSLIDKVSGVTEAVQGRVAAGTTAASLYSQQVSNSQLNYRVIFETMNSFIRSRDEKLIKTLMQFYTEKRLVDIGGNESSPESRYWSPVDVSKITDFNLVVTQSYQTPTYKLQIEDQLLNMLNNRYIDFETYLKNSSLPFTKRLLAQQQNRDNGEEIENVKK